VILLKGRQTKRSKGRLFSHIVVYVIPAQAGIQYDYGFLLSQE